MDVFSKNTPSHPQKRLVMAAIVRENFTLMRLFLFFQPCLKKLMRSKVHFEHALYISWAMEVWKKFVQTSAQPSCDFLIADCSDEGLNNIFWHILYAFYQ